MSADVNDINEFETEIIEDNVFITCLIILSSAHSGTFQSFGKEKIINKYIF